MNAVIHIALKDLRQRLRDRSALVMALILPLSLAFIFNLIFGPGATPRPFRYAVANLDGGQVSLAFTEQVLPTIAKDGFIEIRLAADRQEAWALAQSGSVDAAFVLPPGTGETAGIEVIGNPEAPTGTQVAAAIARSFTAELNSVRLAVTAVSGTSDASHEELVRRALATARPFVVEDVSATGRILDPKTYFAAAMAVFFLFFTVQYGVISLLDERQLGTLRRMMAAPISFRAILVGKLLTSFLLGVVSMTVLVLATSAVMGAHWGNPIGVAILILSGVCAATGLTALVASVARTADLAGSWQAVMAVVLGLLGGAFFPVSQLGGVVGQLSMLTPHAWFLRGLAELSGGGSVGRILPPAAAMLAFAAVTGLAAAVRLGRIVRP